MLNEDNVQWSAPCQVSAGKMKNSCKKSQLTYMSRPIFHVSLIISYHYMYTVYIQPTQANSFNMKMKKNMKSISMQIVVVMTLTALLAVLMMMVISDSSIQMRFGSMLPKGQPVPPSGPSPEINRQFHNLPFFLFNTSFVLEFVRSSSTIQTHNSLDVLSMMVYSLYIHV